MASQLLRVSTIGSASPHWAGTYELGADAVYRRRLPRGWSGEQHEIVKIEQQWELRLGGRTLAKQKEDPEGPLTGPGRRPWKFLATDGRFHLNPEQPLEVEEAAEEDELGESDEAELPPTAFPARGAGSVRRRVRGNAVDSGLAGLEAVGVEVVVAQGFERRPEDMDPGEAVLLCVRVREGPAIGWQCEGRLEVDRHHDKETTRSTRWRFMKAGEVFLSLHGAGRGGVCVEHCGVPRDAFEQLRTVKDDLRGRLAGRRDALQAAGNLVDQEAESIWQKMLEARNTGASTAALKRLRAEWLQAAPEAPTAPEWDLALPRHFCRKRAGEASGQRLAGARTSQPLRRRPRDEFLAHLTRRLFEEAQAAGGGGASGSDAEGGGSGTEGTDGNGRKRRRADREVAAGAEEVLGTEEDADEAMEEPANAALQPSLVRSASKAVPLRQLLVKKAAEEAFLETQAAIIWERLASGAAGPAGAEAEDFTARDCDIAWRYAVALATLGQADAQFHTAIVDLSRDSLRHGIAPGQLLARLLVLKEALLGSVNSVDGFANVLRPLVTVGLGLSQPGSADPAVSTDDSLASQALLGLVAKSGRSALQALAAVLQEPVPAEAPLLFAFGALLCAGVGNAKVLAGAAAETIPRLLRPDAPWPCWRRGLAALLGVALAGCEVALEALFGYLREDTPWPGEAARFGKWELWLLLAASPMSERARALPMPKPKLERAMPIWEAELRTLILQSGGSDAAAAREARGMVVAVAPLVPEKVGKGHLEKIVKRPSGKETTLDTPLVQIFKVWAVEAALLREALDAGHGSLGDRWHTYAAGGAMAAMALRIWQPEPLGQRSSRTAAAAACLSGALSLLLAPGAGREAAKQARNLVETNCGSPLAGSKWPIPLPSLQSKDHRFSAAGLSSEGKLAHLRGRPFTEVYGDKKLVEWMLKKHLEDWRPAGAPTPEAASSVRSPEVNRFASWLLEVFAGGAPLLLLPRPSVADGSVEKQLQQASLRAALVCHAIFTPLLRHKPSIPPWLRAAALAAALRAGCLGLADPDEGVSDDTGQVAVAAQELLGLLGEENDGSPANAALAQAAKLEGGSCAFVLAGFARDCHILLQWLQRLGSAGEKRGERLLRLVAVASRHLQGKWPPPPACPSEAWAQKLCYNPLHSAPPGSPPTQAISARLLALRPLSALLAYMEPPTLEAGMQLASLRGLEAFVGAWRPDAAQLPEGPPPEFGIWAEALAGSDTEDFVRLRGWRLRTFEVLSGAKRSQLAAAVSSRCTAVHCTVALRRAAKQGASSSAVTNLLLVLLRDFGEASGAEVLRAHRRLLQAVLAKKEPLDCDLWAVRHLASRCSAVDRLVRSLGEKGKSALAAELTTALRRLDLWVKKNGFADKEEVDVEALLQSFTAELCSLPLPGFERASDIIVEELAPAASRPDGCFGGVEHRTRDVLKALWAASSA